MNRTIFKFILCNFILFFSTRGVAQVTIGSSVEPESYEILKIVSNGNAKGLRLPRYSDARLKSLSASFDNETTKKAIGLMCYNLDTKRVVVWNGLKWAESIGLGVDNGIQFSSSSKIQLGGQLLETTNLDLAGNNLSLSNIVNGGEFNINDTDFKNVDKTIQVGDVSNTVNVVVNNSTLDIDNNSIKLSATDNSVHIGTSPALSIVNNSIIENGDFQHNYSGTTDPTSKYDYVATAESTTGKIGWIQLISSTKTKSLDISPFTSRSNTNYFSANWTSVSSVFTLEVGKWFVLSRFSLYTSVKTNSKFYNAYIRIRRISDNESVYNFSILSEVKNASGAENKGSYVSPTTAAFLEVKDQSETFVIEVATVQSNMGRATAGWVGPNYATAIMFKNN